MPTTTINLTGQALSKVDDTNVTITLGGTPATALLKATSLTLGWTGTLAATRGGTGLGALGTANQLLRVNAGATALEYFTPSFGSGTVTGISIATANGLAGTSDGNAATPTITLSTSITGMLKGNGTAISAAVNGVDYLTPASISTLFSTFTGTTNIVTLGTIGTGTWQGTIIGKAYGGTGVNIATTALTLGTASSTVGSIVLQNATNANTITIQSGVTSSSHTLTLPTANASGVLTNNGSGTLTWAAASSGITIGSTTITSGTDNRILFQDATASDFVTQIANFTMGSVATGYLDVPVGYAIAGNKFAISDAVSLNQSVGYLAGAAMRITTFDGNQDANTYIGIEAGRYTSGSYAENNTVVGYKALLSSGGGGNPENYNNTAIGAFALGTWASGTGYNVAVGYRAGYGTGSTLRYSTFVGYQAGDGSTFGNSMALGCNATTTAANQCVIGAAAAASGTGVYNNLYFNGVTHTSAAPIVINGCGGSGTNNAGASLTFATRSTGNATPPNIIFQTGTTLGSGTTLQTAATRFTIGELRLTADVPVKFKGYTVATLPAGSVGDTAYVTDATAPTYLGALVGGGAVTCRVFYNGAAWVSC